MKNVVGRLHGYKSLRQIERETGISHQRLSEIARKQRELTPIVKKTLIKIERKDTRKIVSRIQFQPRSFAVSKDYYEKEKKRIIRETIKQVRKPRRTIGKYIVKLKNLKEKSYQMVLVAIWKRGHVERIVTSYSKAHATRNLRLMMSEAVDHARAILQGSSWMLKQILSRTVKEFTP